MTAMGRISVWIFCSTPTIKSSSSSPFHRKMKSLIHILKKWHVKMMDRHSVFEPNRKWHICLFLLGLHIRCWDTKRSETLLSVDVCVSQCAGVCWACVTVNLYFEISKSGSCLSMKDIHSIFVSQMIPQRRYISSPDASDSHSNQVCKVAAQRI